MSRFTFTSSLGLALVVASLTSSIAAPTAGAPSFARPPGTPVVDASVGFVAPAIDRASLRAKLVSNRAANLARFRAYRLAGSYPSNVFTPGLANVWLDQQGKFCAAATIIRASGHQALVDQVAADDNFIRLAEVEQGPLMDWILTSGLTQAEIALIQRPFRPVTTRPVLEPTRPVLVNARLRAAETRRLGRLYRNIEAKLARSTKASIELALDRLIAQPDLAEQLLDA